MIDIAIRRPLARFILVCTLAAFAVLVTHSIALFAATRLERGLGRHDLWRVINFVCVPSAYLGISYPCAKVHFGVDGGPGWALLPVAANHVLTVPTTRIEGIESPSAQAPESAAYWRGAWEARLLIAASHGAQFPRSRYGLAINSAFARSQDQLHIHTSCIDPSVNVAIAQEKSRIGQQWTRLHTLIAGVPYMVRRLDKPDLAGLNIIDLLPQSVKANKDAMARQTLVVVGATFDDGTDGYYILNTQASRSNVGVGEALLDFECL